MADKPDAYRANKRCYCTLAGPTRRLLDLLADKGTHGPDRAAVMGFLVMRGIQLAIQDGYLCQDDVTPPPAANIPSTGG